MTFIPKQLLEKVPVETKPRKKRNKMPRVEWYKIMFTVTVGLEQNVSKSKLTSMVAEILETTYGYDDDNGDIKGYAGKLVREADGLRDWTNNEGIKLVKC